MAKKLLKELQSKIRKKDLLLFVGFYLISSLIYYTATWIGFGGFKEGHPSYFSVEEFFAASGSLFLVNFLVTLPIWYLTIIRLDKKGLQPVLLAHLFLLPVYLFVTYYLLLEVKAIFGWAMYFGGNAAVWAIYINSLFYVVQFGLIHAYIYHQKYKRELTEKAELRESVLKSEITALKSQLNPHFLHNLFNSINASIPKENESTRELIIQLSDLFRYQNAASQKELVTIEEDLGFIKNYLDLIKVRIKERITVHYHIDPQCLHRQIPPMILQPIVENAVTHGISPKIGNSELTITVKTDGNKTHFCIADTGIGLRKKEALYSKGLGLSNTGLRLKKMYDADLCIEANSPSGVKVSFSI